MNRAAWLGAALLAFSSSGCSTETSAAQARPSAGSEAGDGTPSYVHPVIAEHGRAVALPDAAFQPDADTDYRVVFDVTSGASSPGEINPGLEKIARFLNIYGTAGVQPSDMSLVAVFHGDATAAALSDDAHRRAFGQANPNTALIASLQEAGVALHVCGQALAHKGYERAAVAEDVDVALAALTLTPTLALQGYHVQPL